MKVAEFSVIFQRRAILTRNISAVVTTSAEVMKGRAAVVTCEVTGSKGVDFTWTDSNNQVKYHNIKL